MILGGLDHLAHAAGVADITGVDAQAGGTGFGGLNRAFVVEMDVCDDRHRAFGTDFAQGQRAFAVRGRNAHNIRPGHGTALNLFDGRLDVGGQRVGHRLHRDRRIAPDGHFAHHDLTRLAAVDIAPGADRIVRHLGSFRLRQRRDSPGPRARQPTYQPEATGSGICDRIGH